MNKTQTIILTIFGLLLAGVAAISLVAGIRASGAQSSVGSYDSRIEDLEKGNESLEERLAEFELDQGFSVDDEVDKGGFQAVFLSDDSVYFGKLRDGAPGQVQLSQVYYLVGAEYAQGEDITGFSGDVQLVKLGNEMHGPHDMMHITRDQVRFWENLKEDSQIVKSIRSYEKQS